MGKPCTLKQVFLIHCVTVPTHPAWAVSVILPEETTE